MNQKKIGSFLRELRREKNLTQEQLAEMLGVTNRSISRWENGASMPDFDLVMELADYFDVSLEEFLDGERRERIMDKKTEGTLLKMADYENSEKIKFSKRLCGIFAGATIALVAYAVIEIQGLADHRGMWQNIASFLLGLIFGTLLLGVIFTSRYMAKIQAFKRRLLCKIGKRNGTHDKG